MSKFALRTKPEYVISEDAAHDQVMKLLEYYDIDLDAIEQVNKLGAKQLERVCSKLVDLVRQGIFEVTSTADNALNVTHRVKGLAEPLVYSELSAKHKLAMDRAEGQSAKMYALMGGMCGLGQAAIEKLPHRHLSAVEVLSTLFSNA